DGSHGFDLIGLTSPPDPGRGLSDPPEPVRLLVEFNPQEGTPPEPVRPQTTLSLDDPRMPALNNPTTGNAFYFVFSFLNLGTLDIFPPDPCSVAVADTLDVPPGP